MTHELLGDLFTRYLQEGAASASPATQELARRLREHGLPLEAELLTAYAAEGPGRRLVVEGPWAGRVAHLGPGAPEDAAAGELWLDTCELVAMILVPRDDADSLSPELLQRVTPFAGWMSLRPVARWQLAAFLALARYEAVPQPYRPPVAWLDRERLVTGDETAAVSRLALGEAGLYARWFGKGLADQSFWQAAAVAMDALPWGTPPREWAGISSFDEATHVVISPETYALDPRDEADAGAPPDPALRMLYPDGAAPEGVTFRTAVESQLGLQVDQAPSDAGLNPARLLDRFARPPR